MIKIISAFIDKYKVKSKLIKWVPELEIVEKVIKKEFLLDGSITAESLIKKYNDVNEIDLPLEETKEFIDEILCFLRKEEIAGNVSTTKLGNFKYLFILKSLRKVLGPITVQLVAKYLPKLINRILGI